MKEFVYGSDFQYEVLKSSLNDRLCHVYNNCSYPPNCNVERGRLGFEKENDTYALFIDKGVICSRIDAPQLFKDWLAAGVLRFLEFTDLKEFLRSLRILY